MAKSHRRLRHRCCAPSGVACVAAGKELTSLRRRRTMKTALGSMLGCLASRGALGHQEHRTGAPHAFNENGRADATRCHPHRSDLDEWRGDTRGGLRSVEPTDERGSNVPHAGSRGTALRRGACALPAPWMKTGWVVALQLARTRRRRAKPKAPRPNASKAEVCASGTDAVGVAVIVPGPPMTLLNRPELPFA